MTEVTAFFDITVTNEMRTCGETISEQMIVEKVLRSLTAQFDYIVVAIEQSKDTSTMKIDELQGSLEALELRVPFLMAMGRCESK